MYQKGNCYICDAVGYEYFDVEDGIEMPPNMLINTIWYMHIFFCKNCIDKYDLKNSFVIFIKGSCVLGMSGSRYDIVLRRDNYMCQRCGRKVISKKFPEDIICHKEHGFEVDHIKASSLGGNNNLDNLQLLCRSCHVIKTREDIAIIRRVRMLEMIKIIERLCAERRK